MMREGIIFGTSNIIAVSISLIRNIIIARFMSVDNFGIASTFAIVISMFEVISYTGIDRLIIQSKDNNEIELQKTLHSLQVSRGIFGAVAMLFLADVIALLFKLPETVWAYKLLALVPFLRGFVHLDVFRAQREMRFLPQIFVDLTSIGISTALVYPLALWLGDYRVMLYAIIVQQSIYVIGTHLTASIRYRLGWNIEFAKKSLIFGWPLILNSILLFITFNGDRLLVGSFIGMAELGWFSAAFGLAMVPTGVITKTLSSFCLPQLSKMQDEEEEFVHLHLATLEASLLAGILMALGFALIGPWFIVLLYGHNYQPAAQLVVLLAVMQAVRIAKAGPTIVAMAKAETQNLMIANAFRLVSFPAAWIVIVNGGKLFEVIAVAILAELLSFFVSLFLLRRRLKMPLRPVLISMLGILLALCWIGIDSMLFPNLSLASQACHVIPVAILAGVTMFFMRDLMKWLKELRFDK